MTTKSLELKAQAAADVSKRKIISKRRRVSLPQTATAWIALIPAMIFITLFMLYPIVNTFVFAFLQNFTIVDKGGSFALGQFFNAVNISQKTSFGFDNFRYVLQNASFRSSIVNTAILTIVEVPLNIFVSLLIATFLNNIKALKGVYQTIFFLPYVTNTIALGLVFNIAFSSNSGGLVNIVLKDLFNVDPIKWLTNPDPSVGKITEGVVIVLYSLWNGIAFKILVFMAGLATIDSQYYNAAKIDGASNFTIWRRITLPLLSPQILYITITSFIGSFKMYTGVMTVYQGVQADMYYFGGPTQENWIPVVGWIYKEAEKNGLHPGYASAASLVLLGIIMVITVVQFAVSKKKVNY